MTIKIPGQVGWKQTNRTDVLGSLWSTFGIDLQSNLGTVRLAPRLRTVSTTGDLANLGCPTAFQYFGGAFRTVAGARLFNGGATPNATFSQDAATGTPTDCTADSSDLAVFDARLWVTTTDEWLSNGSSHTYGDWTGRGALSSGVPHILRYFPKFNRLYVTNGTTVRSIDTGNTVASSGDYFISLASGNLIMSMDTTDNQIWLGIQSADTNDMGGKIMVWDGISADVSRVYPVDAKGVFAIKIDKETGVPYAIDSNGRLLKFNGSGFQEIGRLPFKQLPVNPDGNVANRFIHFNGLLPTKNGTVLALVNNLNNDNGTTIEENLPSGVWEWSKENGFVHKHPLTYTTAAASTITDFGQNRLSRVGAIAEANKPSTTSGRNGTIMVGATYYTNASDTSSAVFIDDSLDVIQKNGYFATTKILSPSVVDAWGKFYLRFKRLLDSGDKIVVKYRTSESTAVESSITWVNTTSFTVTAANVPSLAVGDEVEVIRGVGSGKCAHVTAITGTTTYTVTVDETFTGATTTTATARFQKWKKIISEASTAKDYTMTNLVLQDSTWIQFKVFMQFKGADEIYDIKLDNKSIV